jgi:hypothetical protein
MFQSKTWKRLASVTDGTSNSFAVLELKVGGHLSDWYTEYELSKPSKITPRHPEIPKWIPKRPLVPPPKDYGRGKRWTDGAPAFTAINTILGPNDGHASNRSVHELVNGLYTAGSYHPGHIMALYVDASVHVISAKIDNGDLTIFAPNGASGEPSPYGIWGKLGTIACGEVTHSEP